MREGFDAITQYFLILRRPRSGRLEGRTAGNAARVGNRGKPLGGAGPGERGEALLRRHAVGDRLLGVFVAQFVEAEMAACDNFEEAKPGLGDRTMLADAGQHVLQRPPLGDVVEHIAHREERQPALFGDRGEAGKAAHIVAAIEMMRGEIGAAGKIRCDPRGEFSQVALLRRQHDNDLTLAMGHDIGIVEAAFTLGRAPFAEGQEPRQPAIGDAVFGIGKEARAVGEVEPNTDDEADPDGFRRMMRAHQPGDAVPVGDRDRLVAERRRGHHQLVGMRRTAQKREIAGDLQLSVIRPGVGAAVAAGGQGPSLAR